MLGSGEQECFLNELLRGHPYFSLEIYTFLAYYLLTCVFGFLKNLFIFGCIGSSLLRRRAFSSCGEQGLLFIAVRGLLTAVSSLVAEHGL